VPGIGTHDSNGRHQQAIAPGGIGRQENKVCWKGSKPLQSLVDKVDKVAIIRNYDL
jgi:hypothetical protein